MKTEFLIPFELDTTNVEKKIEEDAYKEAVDRLYKEFQAALPKRFSGIDWDRIMYHAVNEFMEKRADEIIDTTVLLLAQKVGNRKRWREALKEIKNKEKGGTEDE